jgi:hypothetical protein
MENVYRGRMLQKCPFYRAFCDRRRMRANDGEGEYWRKMTNRTIRNIHTAVKAKIASEGLRIHATVGRHTESLSFANLSERRWLLGSARLVVAKQISGRPGMNKDSTKELGQVIRINDERVQDYLRRAVD